MRVDICKLRARASCALPSAHSGSRPKMPKKDRYAGKAGQTSAGKAPGGGTPAQKDVRNPDRIRTNLADTKRESEFRARSLSVFNPHVESAVSGRRGLRATELVEEQPGFIVAVENLFSADECCQLAAAIDAVGLNPPNAADLNPRKNEAFLCTCQLWPYSACLEPQLCTMLLYPR